MRRLAAAALVVLSACLPVIRPTPDGGFSISPATAQADPGQAVRFVLLAATGAPPPVTWTVTGGGAVAADGTFTAPGCASALPATITITATTGSTTATATVQVADKVTAVSISPATVSLAPGQTQAFTATVRSVCFPGGMVQNLKATRPKDGGAVAVAGAR
jgi:plastocyanin